MVQMVIEFASCGADGLEYPFTLRIRSHFCLLQIRQWPHYISTSSLQENENFE